MTDPNLSPYLTLPIRTLEKARADRAQLAAERAAAAARQKGDK